MNNTDQRICDNSKCTRGEDGNARLFTPHGPRDRFCSTSCYMAEWRRRVKEAEQQHEARRRSYVEIKPPSYISRMMIQHMTPEQITRAFNAAQCRKVVFVP